MIPANDPLPTIGKMPYRLALSGGWIDQPFVSKHNPSPPGSMVVVNLQPICRYMDRCGLGTSTRKIAQQVWGDEIPKEDPQLLIKQLYAVENAGKAEPSGSQDMAGLVYPGINRLDYDFNVEGGYFPSHVETNTNPGVVSWLEEIFYLLPVAPRPPGYSPLGVKNLEAHWIQRLGRSGQECFAAILTRDLPRLGAALNETMRCWEAILPHTVRHPLLSLDLMKLLHDYQERYPGAMFSGCGGGYLYVVSGEPVPGAAKIRVRV